MNVSSFSVEKMSEELEYCSTGEEDEISQAMRVSKRPLAAAGVAAATAAAARKKRSARPSTAGKGISSEDGSKKRAPRQHIPTTIGMSGPISSTGEGYYPCRSCGKVCTSAQQLGGHQNSHRDEKMRERGGVRAKAAESMESEDSGSASPPRLPADFGENLKETSAGGKLTPQRPQKSSAGKPTGLAGRPRPTNNQLLYKAHFRWNHYSGRPESEGFKRPSSTEACASVTSAFLQVLRAIYVAERESRNVLKILSGNTRRTKVVALASGSHRVPDELRRHSLGDEDGNEYSTNLDRNRYGNDDQYLSTVIRYDLEFLGLCPGLVDVEIIDAKSRSSDALLISVGQAGCVCGSDASSLPAISGRWGAANTRTVVVHNTVPVPVVPQPAPTFPKQVTRPTALGGIGMLLDAMAASGHGPPPSPMSPSPRALELLRHNFPPPRDPSAMAEPSNTEGGSSGTDGSENVCQDVDTDELEAHAEDEQGEGPSLETCKEKLEQAPVRDDDLAGSSPHCDIEGKENSYPTDPADAQGSSCKRKKQSLSPTQQSHPAPSKAPGNDANLLAEAIARENSSLREALVNSNAECVQLRNENSQLAENLAQAERQNASLQCLIQEQVQPKEVTPMGERIDETKNTTEQSAEPTSLGDGSHRAAGGEQPSVSDAQQQCFQLRAEVAQLTASLAATQADAKQQVHEFMQALTSLQRQYIEQVKHSRELADEAGALRRGEREMAGHLQLLQQDLAASRLQLQESQEQCTQAEAELRRLRPVHSGASPSTAHPEQEVLRKVPEADAESPSLVSQQPGTDARACSNVTNSVPSSTPECVPQSQDEPRAPEDTVPKEMAVSGAVSCSIEYSPEEAVCMPAPSASMVAAAGSSKSGAPPFPRTPMLLNVKAQTPAVQAATPAGNVVTASAVNTAPQQSQLETSGSPKSPLSAAPVQVAKQWGAMPNVLKKPLAVKPMSVSSEMPGATGNSVRITCPTPTGTDPSMKAKWYAEQLRSTTCDVEEQTTRRHVDPEDESPSKRARKSGTSAPSTTIPGTPPFSFEVTFQPTADSECGSPTASSSRPCNGGGRNEFVVQIATDCDPALSSSSAIGSSMAGPDDAMCASLAPAKMQPEGVCHPNGHDLSVPTLIGQEGVLEA